MCTFRLLILSSLLLTTTAMAQDRRGPPPSGQRGGEADHRPPPIEPLLERNAAELGLSSSDIAALSTIFHRHGPLMHEAHRAVREALRGDGVGSAALTEAERQLQLRRDALFGELGTVLDAPRLARLRVLLRESRPRRSPGARR